jgi:hypothetical protein
MGTGILRALPAAAIALAACSGDPFVIRGSGNDGGSDGGSSSDGSPDGGNGSDGSLDGGSAGDGSMTADQACTHLVDNLCSKLEACAPFLIQIQFGNLMACKQRSQMICPSLLASGPGARSSNLEACAQAYAAVSCDDVVSNKPPGACDFHGSAAAGAVCAVTAQCSAGRYCSFSGGKSCGVCSPLFGSGGSCSADSDCQSGLVCPKPNNAATGSCTVPGAQGAACDGTHTCLATLGCSAGTCTPTLGPGAQCSTTQPCDSLLRGLYCNRLNLCAQITTVAPGVACGLFADGTARFCSAGGKCKMADGAATGTCEAPAADGASCDATNGPLCLAPALCINGACTLPDPASCH